MKKKFIDSVRVKDPCTQSWDEMVGNDKVRFCTHCAKDVNNLSSMTRKEALRIVRRSGGSLCIRYVQRPETNGPMFAGELTQITRRRAPLIAASVMTASLSLTTIAYAQGGAAFPPSAAAPTVAGEREGPAGAKKKPADPQVDPDEKMVRGRTYDANGAAIPGLQISLKDTDGNVIRKMSTDADGGFRFDKIKHGSYVLATSAQGGFGATEKNFVTEIDETIVDVSVDVASIRIVLGGVMSVGPEFEHKLTLAVSRDDVDEVRNLLIQRENPNHKEDDGTTPLFVAVENGNHEIVALLLDFGAKVNVRNDQKETPLMFLDDDAPVELVELLLRQGADVTRVSQDGDTALARAARSAKPEVLSALINAGAELNKQDDNGWTALMRAAESGNLENVRVLLLAGADVNLRDKDGDNAWDHATEGEIEKLLVRHGVMLDPGDSSDSEDEPEDTDPDDTEPEPTT